MQYRVNILLIALCLLAITSVGCSETPEKSVAVGGLYQENQYLSTLELNPVHPILGELHTGRFTYTHGFGSKSGSYDIYGETIVLHYYDYGENGPTQLKIRDNGNILVTPQGGYKYIKQ